MIMSLNGEIFYCCWADNILFHSPNSVTNFKHAMSIIMGKQMVKEGVKMEA
jgi:hypothetical protein